jgi:catechol 2,3-dioxygenase-like lactoylglutathione lyase family enzyme
MAKTKSKRAAKSGARARKASRQAKPARAARRRGSDLAFNHAMIYAADVGRSLAFYESLGFETLETQLPYYARLATGGNSTIALHGLEPGQTAAADGIRLYFETPKLTALHKQLAQAGVAFSKPPAKQPWGWTHAYLNDPDGHEISLYWAGSQRLKRSRK